MAELFQPTSAQIRDIIGLPETLIKLGPIHSIIETSSVLDLGPTGDVFLSLDQPNAKILARKEIDMTTKKISNLLDPTNPQDAATKIFVDNHTWVRADITDTPWTKAELPATTVYTDQANTFGAFAQRFPTTQLQLDNPAGTFQYIFATSALIADRTVTLPLLTGNDAFVFNAFATTLTNKILALGSNTISGTAAQFDTAVTDDNFAFVSDNLSVFAATTSLQLAGVISDETGSGLLVFGTNATLVTPTIASFVNATHSHLNAAGGGTITKAAISDTPWAKADLPATTVYTDQANVMGNFDFTLKDNRLRIENPAGTFEVGFQTSAEIADRVLTIPLLGANRTIVVTGLVSQITLGTEVTGASTNLTDSANLARNTNNLSFFAVTTSAQLAGIISNETGSGLLVFGTSPTIVTPTIVSFVNATHTHQNAAGGGTLVSTLALSDTADIAYLNTANVYSAGLKQTVDTGATNAGFRDLGHTADPSSAASGDKYYNTTSNEYKWYNGTVWKTFAESGGAGEANTISSLGGGTVLTAATPKSGVDLRTVSIATTAPIAHSVTTDLMTFTLNALVNADIAGGAAIVTSKLADSANFVLINQANTFGLFDQQFKTSRLIVRNPADTFGYLFAGSAIVANRTITLPLLTVTDTIAVLALAQTFTNKTLTEPIFVNNGFLKDVNGNEIIAFGVVASAVNNLKLINAATGSPAELQAVGGDTDIDILLTPKGIGVVRGHRESYGFALSDEDTAPLTTGVKITTVIVPYDFNIDDVIISVVTAGTGAVRVTVDILRETALNTNVFETIFTTKPTIDASAFSSETAATQPVINAAFDDVLEGERIQLKIDTIDTGLVATGLKVVIAGHALAR